jgi:hypothetical protein
MVHGQLFEKENELKVKMPVEFFTEVLGVASIKGFPTLALEFFEGQVRIRSYSMQKSEYLNMDAKHNGLEIGSAGYLVVPVQEIEGYMKKFSGNITISWSHGDKIHIKDENGNEAEIVPKDLSELPDMPKESRIYPANENGEVMFPQRDEDGSWKKDDDGNNIMAPLKTQVGVASSELAKGIFDMTLAKADYAIYNFSQDGSTVSSGQYYKKGNMSKSNITAEVSGPDIKVVVPSVMRDVLKVMDGNLRVQADKDFKMVFFTKTKEADESTIDVRVGIVQYKPEEKKQD